MIGAVSSSPIIALSASVRGEGGVAPDPAAQAGASTAAAPPIQGGKGLLSVSSVVTAQSDHGGTEGELSAEEQAQVEKLKARDREVKAHEHAHASAGGDLAGSPSYEYEQGPDGQRYAVGGEVKIDVAPVKGNPAATIAKMQRIIAAALAPAEPSGQDRSVAARARSELAKAQTEETGESGDAPQARPAGQISAQGGEMPEPVSIII